MKIGELAQRSGLAASRIRFYEAAGLLPVVQRGANGYREYPDEALQLLDIIVSAQKAGFSLDEIRPLLPQPAPQGGWQQQALIDSLLRKADDIAQMQKRLARTRRQLLAVADEIRNRPPGLACADNLERVLSHIRPPRASRAGTAPAARHDGATRRPRKTAAARS